MKEKEEKKQRGRDGVLNLRSTGGQGERGERVPEMEPNKRGLSEWLEDKQQKHVFHI